MPSPDFSSWRVLVTGVTSIHGWPIYKRLKAVLGEERLLCIRPPNAPFPQGKNIIGGCMTDASMFQSIQRGFRPTHVLHAAGVCDLDMCEERPDFAHAINAGGAKNVVEVFSPYSYLMYLSADLVFSGHAPPPAGYTEDDAPCPVSVVGRTYAAAESEFHKAPRACIVRIGLPMGPSVQGEKGAIDFIEGRFRRNLPMTLFYNELRSCIHCDELAELTVSLFLREERGIFHCGGPRAVSLYEIGERIIGRGGYGPGLLKRCSRLDEKNGPPRVGNVHLDSRKLERLLGKKVSVWPGGF